MARNWTPPTDEEIDAQIEQATRRAEESDRVEPRAEEFHYDPRRGVMMVRLRSGAWFGFPPEWVPGLEAASDAELSDVWISPSGDGLHWEAPDVAASLSGIVVNALRLRERAPRLTGRSKSEARAKASRANGKKGDRPRKSAPQ